jgi:hypothetical protein
VLEELVHLERDGEDMYVEVVKTNYPRKYGRKKERRA